MANIIVCADGTWNTPDEKHGGLPTPTNVAKLYNAIADAKPAGPDKDVPQKAYYHPGVGTDGKWWDRIAGGGTGLGLSQNIMSGYNWLARNYAEGDNIFLFGFSRGAFTVRSLGGMISSCGLLDLEDLPDDGVWKRVEAAFTCYRDPKHNLARLAKFKFHNAPDAEHAPKSTKIHFIGVWDTVGALGIPDDLAFLDLIDNPRDYEFHDTDLSEVVTIARHAVAIDEMRKSFAPTLWTGYPDDQDVQQIWFPGVHGDVGGGYYERGLADGALRWMMDEAASEKAGLAFRPNVRKQLVDDEHDVLHDSCTGIFSALKTEPRQVPNLETVGAAFHKSATGRHDDPSIVEDAYWKTRALKPNESATLDIFASRRWNVTGLFLEKNATYQFEATGQWLDGDDKFSAAGVPVSRFNVREAVHAASAALGEVESVYKWITSNPKADFWATRRYEKSNWLKLMGVIANGAISTGEKSLPDHQWFEIGEAAEVTPMKSGYLYCFANDAWHAYGNNKGSVSLTVSRKS